MCEEFAFISDHGNLLVERGRTRASLAVFITIVLVPFAIFTALSFFAWRDWTATEGWDMNPLGWLLFTLSVLIFLFWLFLRRIIGFQVARLYQNGLRLTSYFCDIWIPWNEISLLKHEHTIFYVKFVPLKYNILIIFTSGKRFDIESGTGFTFADWKALFSEIAFMAQDAEFKEEKDWMSF